MQLVEETLDESGVTSSDVVGVGMGLPGPIDSSTGKVGSSAILPGWVGVRAEEELGRRLDLPVAVDNDANLGALGELRWGAEMFNALNANYTTAQSTLSGPTYLRITGITPARRTRLTASYRF